MGEPLASKPGGRWNLVEPDMVAYCLTLRPMLGEASSIEQSAAEPLASALLMDISLLFGAAKSDTPAS
jgi:hypothetical protein